MSRRAFASAVLLLLVVMIFCGTGAALAEVKQSSETKFQWKGISEGDVTVESLGAPSLLNVGSGVFAVAEAQCKKKDGEHTFTGIASQLLTETGKEPKEVLNDVKDTQVLEEGTSSEEERRVDVSGLTAVVGESDIYMIVGKHSHEAAANCQTETEIKSGILLVKGEVSDKESNKQIHWKETGGVPCTLDDQQNSLKRLIGGGGSGVKMEDGTLVFPVEGTKKDGREDDGKTVSLIILKDTASWTLSKGCLPMA
ncbi:trans-sialidase, partial [Trypanosoma cruzi]